MNWVKIGDAPTQGNYITKTAEKIRPEGLSKTREVHPGDLILSNSMSFGKPYIMGIDGCIHDGWLLIRNTYGVFDLTFLCHLLGTPQMLSQYRSLAAGSTVNNLNKELVGNTYVTIPSITEQRVLGAYLEQLDNLITLHQRECISFTGRADRLILTANKKRTTSSWEQRKLGELVDRVVRKNINNESTLPLTISAQYGLVDQITYFNNRVASRDVSNYYLVLNGEFAYNKSTSDGYPFGAVKRLDLYEKGVLSTLYIVFAPKKEQQIDSDYLTVFFDTDRWHKGVAERAAEGARNHGLLNISAEDFFDIDLSVPKDIVEQKQIGAFIRQLDHLITLHQRKGKAAVSGCFLNCSSLEKSSAQSRTLELFGQTSNQEIKYIIDGLSILGGKLRNFCVKLIILLSYTRINDIAKYHISRNTECVHNIN